jgi:dTDP-4-amino-4,6-dideoxygalactose transaminase
MYKKDKKQSIIPFEKPIYVTVPILPEAKKLRAGIDKIYSSKWLTNMGSFHEELENKITEYLDVEHFLLFNNGTTALMAALKALDLLVGSEVITTPFTFAATPHSIVWSGLKPIFCDIEPETMTIDPDRIESIISANTSAILAVHVYGFPCDVDALETIAKKHKLKIIYDGAHAFTTTIDGRSICSWGDITMLSFHATKLYNTIEGGGLVYNDPKLSQKIRNLRNFGIRDEVTVDEPGINGKMNEFQALYGILNLEMVKAEQANRAALASIYREELAGIKELRIPELPEHASNSLQYFPILISGIRDRVYEKLREYNVFARRYFYPPCTEYGCYRGMCDKRDLPVTYKISSEVLCLPFFGDLRETDARAICRLVRSCFEPRLIHKPSNLHIARKLKVAGNN